MVSPAPASVQTQEMDSRPMGTSAMAWLARTPAAAYVDLLDAAYLCLTPAGVDSRGSFALVR
jgi:hypothetical protein